MASVSNLCNKLINGRYLSIRELNRLVGLKDSPYLSHIRKKFTDCGIPETEKFYIKLDELKHYNIHELLLSLKFRYKENLFDIANTIEECMNEIDYESKDDIFKTDSMSKKDIAYKAKREPKKFKDGMYKLYNKKGKDNCMFCDRKHKLIGAHIVPLCDAYKYPEMDINDPTNGLLLCNNCHGYYDEGEIFYNPHNMKLYFNPELSDKYKLIRIPSGTHINLVKKYNDYMYEKWRNFITVSDDLNESKSNV
jgi:hypothetical protein